MKWKLTVNESTPLTWVAHSLCSLTDLCMCLSPCPHPRMCQGWSWLSRHPSKMASGPERCCWSSAWTNPSSWNCRHQESHSSWPTWVCYLQPQPQARALGSPCCPPLWTRVLCFSFPFWRYSPGPFLVNPMGPCQREDKGQQNLGKRTQTRRWESNPGGDVCACVRAQSLSRVQLFATPWTIASQAPLSMEFSRQECCSGLPFPLQGICLIQGWNLCKMSYIFFTLKIKRGP